MRAALIKSIGSIGSRGGSRGAALGAALSAALGASSGCSLITDSFVTNDFSGDPFPIGVDDTTGAVLVGIRAAGAADRVAVLDVLSPVTVVDPGIGKPPSVTTADLVMLGRSPGGGELDLPRARLDAAQVVALHPCKDDSCLVGAAGTLQPYQAIVGANVLAGDALRLRLGDHQVFVLADVGGDERDRTWACDAVFPAPYRGGGTLVIAGTEVPFGGRRVTMQACLGADPRSEITQAERGADVLLVMSTGIGTSILGEAAYERYRQVRPATPPLELLPSDTVVLASGPLLGRRATIDRLALVATSGSAPRAPCRQVFAHHLLLPRDCTPADDCPCSSGDTFCAVPATVELAPATGLAVLVVPDDNATLQALRTELRPDQPEVDGILGTDAMRAAEIDVDYPHNRVLVRCTDARAAGEDRPPPCAVRPALADAGDRGQILGCVGASSVTPRAR